MLSINTLMEHHKLRSFEPNEVNWRSHRPRPSGSISLDPNTHPAQAPRPRPSSCPSFETNTYLTQTHRPGSSSNTSVESNPYYTQVHTSSSSSSSNPSVESDRYSTPARRPRSFSNSSIDTNPYSTETDPVEMPNGMRPPITPIGHELSPLTRRLNRSLSLISRDFPRPLHHLAALVHASDPDIDHPPTPSHPCVQTLTLVCTPHHPAGTAHSPSCRLVPPPTTNPKLVWGQELWPQAQQTPLFFYRQPLAQTQAQAEATRHWEYREGYKVRMWRQLHAIPEERKQYNEREGERYLGAELRAQMRRVLLPERSGSGSPSGGVDVALGVGLGLGAKKRRGRKGEGQR